MPNLETSSTTDKPILWVGIAGKKELRDLYTALLTTVIAGEWHDYEEMHTTSAILKGMATVRINGQDRLLIKTIQKNGGNYIVIMAEILEHRHGNCMYLNPDISNKQKEESLQKLIDALKDSDFVKITLSKGTENSNPEIPPVVPTLPAFHLEYAHLLTSEQRMALGLSLPCRVEASAGFGKTHFAAVYLKNVMDSLIESLKAIATIVEIDRQIGAEEKEEKVAPIDLVYVAKTEKLVQDFSQGYQALPGAKTSYGQARIQFKTIKQLAHENLEQPKIDGNRISVDRPVFARWLISYQKMWANKEKGNSKAGTAAAIDRTRVFKKPALLYTELCYMVILKEAEYLEHGINIRGTKDYFRAEERPFLWQLCKDYIEHMQKTGQYDLSLNPPPLKKSFLHTIAIDEVQGLSPKLIAILLGFSTNRQFLLLYGLHQSLYLCNRQFIQVHDIPRVLFTKSLRNPHDVTLMANNVLRAQGCFGKPDKEDQSEFMEPNPDIPGKIYWGDLHEIPASLMTGKDASLTILTREKYIKEAEDKFKTKCVNIAEHMQGTDCNNLVLYRMSDDPIFDHISAQLATDDHVPTGHRPKTSGPSAEAFSIGEIHAAFDEYQIALTRATTGEKGLRIFEKNARRREAWLKLLKKGVSISAIAEEKTATAHESSLEEWIARAEKVFKEEENEDLAKNILESLPKKFPSTFSAKQAEAILASWKPSEPPAVQATRSSSKPFETKESATQGAWPATPKGSTDRLSLDQVPEVIVKKYTERNLYKNEKSFVALLDQSQCTALLFGIVKGKPGTLFAYFMEDAERSRLFRYAFVKSHKYQAKLPAALLSALTEQANFNDPEAPLFCITRNAESIALFKYLVDIVPSFAQGITHEALFKRFKDPEGNIAEGLSSCHQFSKTSLGNSVVNALFTKKGCPLPDEWAMLLKTRELSDRAGNSPDKDAYKSHALSLFGNFNEMQLSMSLSTCSFENLFLKTRTHQGTPFALIERLHSNEECRKIFSSCLMNQPKLLCKLPLEKMPNPPRDKNIDKAWDHWLEQLKHVQNTFLEAKLALVEKNPSAMPLIDDMPLLHIAVTNNLGESIFRDIKELGGNFNLTFQKNGTTAAHLAVELNRLKYLPVLKELGTDLTLLDAEGGSLIHYAVRLPDVWVLSFVKKLAPTLSLLLPAKNGSTPAHCASIENNGLMLKKIKELEPSLDIKQIFSLRGANGECVSTTLLHIASMFGKIEIIEALREIDPQLSLSEKVAGQAPLHLAAELGQVDVLRLLNTLDPSLDLEQPGEAGETAAYLAAVADKRTFLFALKELDPNVSLNKPNNSGMTPVYFAVATVNVGLLVTLKVAGVRLNDEKNSTYHLGNLAVTKGNITILELLVNMGYDMTFPGNVSPRLSKKVAPLTLAQSIGKAEVIGFFKEMLEQTKQSRATSPSSKNGYQLFFSKSKKKTADPTDGYHSLENTQGHQIAQ